MKRRSRVGGKQIKGRRGNAALPRGRNSAKPIAHSTSPVAGDETVVARLSRELNEALEQQTATSEVLRVISSSAGDLEPVFASMLENAVRICDAKFGNIYRWDGEALHLLAAHDTPAALVEVRRRSALRPTALILHMVATRTVAHVADLSASEDYVERHPAAVAAVELGGVRTALLVPLLKEDELIGSFTIYRQEVRPFTDKQIALVTNFAAQAVIAIENARLLNELKQSLEQQTASSDVLKVISTSSGDLQPVFEAMLGNAVRICQASLGNMTLYENGDFRHVALHGAPAAYMELRARKPVVTPNPAQSLGRLASTKQLVHIPDILSEPSQARGDLALLASARTLLIVPMLKEQELVGAIGIYRQEVKPFADKQIELLQNFAAQAVIAIENARLLNELRQRTTDLTDCTADLTEALEQQTATSEVLQVISGSPGDLEPVFQAMLENATRICEAKFGVVFSFDGNEFHFEAQVGTPPELAEYNRAKPIPQPLPGSHLDRLRQTKQVSYTADYAAEVIPAPPVTLGGARSTVDVPMLKDNELVGAFSIYRQEVRPFTDKQIDLVKNFAAQAVIAIENARLLNELRQSLEQQTATSDVLQVISSSPGDLEPVFATMLEKAASICDATFGNIFRWNGEAFDLVATHETPSAFAEARRRSPIHPSPTSHFGRLVATKSLKRIPIILKHSLHA